MQVTVNTTTRGGRQLEGLLKSAKPDKRSRGKVIVTVDLKDEAGRTRLHEAIRFNVWIGEHGSTFVTARTERNRRMVFHFNVTPGAPEGYVAKAHKRLGDDGALLMYAVKAAWQFLVTGEAPAPKNGTVTCQEAAFCGHCGRKLTHPDSIPLGIGPDCEFRLTGKITKRGGGTVQGAVDRKHDERVARDGCDKCGTITELFHNDATGLSLCAKCDYAVDSEAKRRLALEDELRDEVNRLEKELTELLAQRKYAAAQLIDDRLDSARAALGKAERDFQLSLV